MSLWEMSVAGGILILAILPVRRLFRNRLPAGTFLVLWTIALLRLLVPISVPAPCNVYTLLEICGVELNPAGLPEIFRMSDTDWNSSETLEQNSAVKKAGSKEQDSAGSGRGDGNAIPDSGKQVRDWRNLFPWRLLYLAGVLGTAVFYGFTYLKCRREFCMALPVEDEAVQKFFSCETPGAGASDRSSCNAHDLRGAAPCDFTSRRNGMGEFQTDGAGTYP